MPSFLSRPMRTNLALDRHTPLDARPDIFAASGQVVWNQKGGNPLMDTRVKTWRARGSVGGSESVTSRRFRLRFVPVPKGITRGTVQRLLRNLEVQKDLPAVVGFMRQSVTQHAHGAQLRALDAPRPLGFGE